MAKHEPKWKRGERFERIGEFDLSASPAQVFPLLCPVREYEWIPDWECTMIYSESGLAEPWAVFHTSHVHGHREVWTVVTYEPDELIEYLIVNGTHAVVRLRIGLSEGTTGMTHVVWSMLFTVSSSLGKRTVSRDFNPERFSEFLELRRRQLAEFLALQPQA